MAAVVARGTTSTDARPDPTPHHDPRWEWRIGDVDVLGVAVLLVHPPDAVHGLWVVDVPADSVDTHVQGEPAANLGVPQVTLVGVLELDRQPLAVREHQPIGLV